MMAQIGRQCLTDITRHRHAARALALATDENLTGTPVDVVEQKRGDFSRPQAETNQQTHDGAVSASDGPVPVIVARRKDVLDLSWFEDLGQRCEAPLRHRRNAATQMRRYLVAKFKEAQQRSGRSRWSPAVPSVVPSTLAQNE
jgi:hypothetical protein